MSDSAPVQRVRALVAPIIRDLHLDLYDLDFRGGILRVTIDTPPGSEGGVIISIRTPGTWFIIS